MMRAGGLDAGAPDAAERLDADRSTPPRIGVAGAGAIGVTVSARLAAAGHRVSVLARGATLAVLRARGVELRDLAGTTRADVVASDDAATLGEQDLLFLCSKSHDLRALSVAAHPMIGPRTLVVPLVNGVPFWYFHLEGGRFEGGVVDAVDPGGELLRRLPLARTLGAINFITAETVAPGVASSTTPHLMMLGEPAGGLSPRLEAQCALLAGAGIEARAVERIRDPLWSKLIANLTSNPLSVTSGATLGEIYTRPDHLAVVRAVMFEARLVAGCYGARLAYDPIEFIGLAAGMGAIRTSMLQDHERRRPLELAAIGDAFVELAERYDVPVPATRRLLAATRACVGPGDTLPVPVSSSARSLERPA